MVDRVETAASPGGLSHLDRHIERMLAETTHPAGDES
jgi:hypothetical protein